MKPGKLNLTIYQGSTWRRVVRLATPAGAVDLSGATVRMHVRAKVTTATTLLELTEANGRALLTDAAGGEITLLVGAADTAALTFDSAVYDLEIEYAGGTVDRVLYGAVKLSKEVTR
jgi:hypothetical protein